MRFSGICVQIFHCIFPVDKDVLCTADASTTWSQGDMSLEELQKFLEIVLQQQQNFGNGYLWGM